MSIQAALTLIYLDLTTRLLAVLATPAGVIIAVIFILSIVLAIGTVVHDMWLGAYNTPESENRPGS